MPFSRYELNTNESDSNVFKIGDWVYCEFEPTQPYSIRRIEELVQVNCQPLIRVGKNVCPVNNNNNSVNIFLRNLTVQSRPS